jgi:hypothetical protein
MSKQKNIVIWVVLYHHNADVDRSEDREKFLFLEIEEIRLQASDS